MKNLINLLILMLIVYTVNVSGATTTTNTVTSPSGNLTIDTASSAGNVVVPSRLQVTSTTKGSHPCPSMTDTQMLAIASPQDGDCVHNTTLENWMVYNSTDLIWGEMGGGGGISQWLTSEDYDIDDVVISTNFIYVCLTAHTSGTFATDLAALKWQAIQVEAVKVVNVPSGNLASTTGQAALNELQGDIDTINSSKVSGPASSVDGEFALFDSTTGKLVKRATGTGFVKSTSGVYSTVSSINLAADVGSSITPMANGGTNKAITAAVNNMLITDADSVEQLTGTTGQIPQFNTAGAMTAVNKSILGKDQVGAAVTLEEIQVPNDQLTNTATGKYRITSCGNPDNLLGNCSFEDTALTAWDVNDGTVTGVTSTSSITDGANSVAYEAYSGKSVILHQDSTLYAAALAGQQGFIIADIYDTSGDVYLCQKKAGVLVASTDGISITNCKKHSGLGQETVTLPVLFDATGTSNGVEVVTLTATTAAVKTTSTGTTRVDSFKFAKGSLAGAVDPAMLAGESYFAGTTSATCTRTSTSVGSLTCNAALPGPTIVRSKLGVWATTDSNLLKQSITGLPSGDYKATFLMSSTMSANNAAAYSITDGTTTCEPVYGPASSASQTAGTVSCSFSYTTENNSPAFELVGGSNTATITVDNSVTAPRTSTKFILERYSSTPFSTYSQSCGAACLDTLSASIGTGASAAVTSEKSDWLPATCTRSSTNNGVATCVPNTGTFTVTPNCSATSEVAATTAVFIRASSTYNSLVFHTYDGANALTGAAFTINCDKAGVDLVASRTLMGTFKGPQSEVWVTGGNAHGSTDTKIRRFITRAKYIGSDITDSGDIAANGRFFTINTKGVYAITTCDTHTATGHFFGVSVNSTQLTTAIQSITQADNRGFVPVGAVSIPSCYTYTENLNAQDVVRAHTEGTLTGTSANYVHFRIAKVNN